MNEFIYVNKLLMIKYFFQSLFSYPDVLLPTAPLASISLILGWREQLLLGGLLCPIFRGMLHNLQTLSSIVELKLRGLLSLMFLQFFQLFRISSIVIFQKLS
jgi:hypothetical protein